MAMKKCPFCAEDIQDEAIKCRFCGSMLNEARPAFGPGDAQALDPDVDRLLRAGDKIGAIRLVREKKNYGLKEAKDYVEGRGVVRAVAGSSAEVRPAPKTSPVAALLAAIVILGGLGWAGGFFSTSDQTGRFVMPQSVVAPKPVVTMAEFDRIENGMSYPEVIGIIGASGQQMSSSDVAGISTVMYSWANSNGSNMNAMFQNGKLISKAQFGLP